MASPTPNMEAYDAPPVVTDFVPAVKIFFNMDISFR